MYWVGMDLRSTDPEQVEMYHRYYGGTHLPEVVASNPGFTLGHRYELVEPDPRGVAAPRYLAVYEMSGEAAADTYMERNDGPPEGRPNYTPGPPAWTHMDARWRMIWRQFAETGSAGEAPESIFVVGIDPPSDVDAAGLAEFNDFYTNVHLPEVLSQAGYARGTRYERVRAFLHPEPGCPRYCAVYEGDAQTPARQDPAAPEPAASPGPPSWQDRTTQWRLVYRRIPV